MPHSPALPPNLAPLVGTPAPPRARLFADCIGQAQSAGSYDANSKVGIHLVRFTCSGAPARAFYTELEPWSAAQRSEWVADGRTWRSTARVMRDLFGVDYCSTDGASDFQCVITLNVGGFLVQ